MDYEEIIDHMIEEKIDCKEYKEIAEEMENDEYKRMFEKIAEDEHNHYRMLKELLSRMMK